MDKIALAPLVLVVALAGCMVGPDYVRPSAPTAGTYKEMEGWKLAQPAAAARRGAWWEAFNDQDLDALMAQVEVNNQNIALFEARVREADAATRAARAALWPLVDLNVNATRNNAATQATGP